MSWRNDAPRRAPGLGRSGWLACTLALAVACCIVPRPAWALTGTFDAAKDAWVWSSAPANNIGSTTTCEVGRSGSKNNAVLLKRALLSFDVSSLPSDAIVTAATLRLYVERTQSDPLGLGLTAWRLTDDFAEGDGTTGVTWDTQPAVETSPTSGGTMNATAGLWFELPVGNVVIAERGSSDPNSVGLRLAATDETTIDYLDFGFRSRE